MTTKTSYPVVIVGAGPTGVTAATLLAQYGIGTLVLDRWADVYAQPRAVHLDDEIYRVLAHLGVAEGFAEISRPALGLRLLDPAMRVLAEWTRDTTLSENGFPQANMFDQPDLETLLRANLKRYPNAELRGNVVVTHIDENGDGRIRVTYLDRADDSEHSVDADYVLGCDGANSIVRRHIGSAMRDMRFEQRWLVIDVATDAELGQWEGVHQVCDPGRAGTYMRIGPKRYRWEFRLLPGESAAVFRTLAALKPLMAPWISRVADADLELVRVSEYTFRAQLADQWRRGNIFLLGDAAHLTPPFIGQGLGAGVRDAMNLAWKLAGVIAGDLPHSALDSYEHERIPHARHMIRLALGVGWAMTAGGEFGNLMRRLVVTRVRFLPGLRNKLTEGRTPALRGSAFVRTSRASRLLAGTLCPNPVLADGRRLDGALGNGFALVTTQMPTKAQCAMLDQRRAALHVAGADDELAAWLRDGHATWAIIRPDRTVMCAGRDLDKICELLPTFSPETRIRSNA